MSHDHVVPGAKARSDADRVPADQAEGARGQGEGQPMSIMNLTTSMCDLPLTEELCAVVQKLEDFDLKPKLPTHGAEIIGTEAENEPDVRSVEHPARDLHCLDTPVNMKHYVSLRGTGDSAFDESKLHCSQTRSEAKNERDAKLVLRPRKGFRYREHLTDPKTSDGFSDSPRDVLGLNVQSKTSRPQNIASFPSSRLTKEVSLEKGLCVTKEITGVYGTFQDVETTEKVMKYSGSSIDTDFWIRELRNACGMLKTICNDMVYIQPRISADFLKFANILQAHAKSFYQLSECSFSITALASHLLSASTELMQCANTSRGTEIEHKTLTLAVLRVASMSREIWDKFLNMHSKYLDRATPEQGNDPANRLQYFSETGTEWNVVAILRHLEIAGEHLELASQKLENILQPDDALNLPVKNFLLHSRTALMQAEVLSHLTERFEIIAENISSLTKKLSLAQSDIEREECRQ